jgi:hypothetical protein
VEIIYSDGTYTARYASLREFIDEETLIAGYTVSYLTTTTLVGGEVTASPGSYISLGRDEASGTMFAGKMYNFTLLPYASPAKLPTGTVPDEADTYSPTSQIQIQYVPEDIRFFDVREMVMKKPVAGLTQLTDDPSCFEDISSIFIGSARTENGRITAITSYAINAMYDSGWYPVTTGQSYPVSHAIGCESVIVDNLISRTPSDTYARTETGPEYDFDGYSRRYYGAMRARMTQESLTMRVNVSGICSPANVEDNGDMVQGFYRTRVKRAF